MALRVAHIINGLGIGGAERHLVNLVNALSCDTRAVICLRGDRGKLSFRKDLDADVEQFVVPVSKWTVLFGLFRLASLLKQKRVNVVHTHMYRASLYGVVAAWLARVPVIVTTEHGENPWKRPVHRFLERFVISPLTNARLCVSPRILECRRQVDGIPAAKLRLITNGTVVPSIEGTKRPNRTPVIGAVGRFIPAKDFPGLVHAVSELRKRGLEFRLCLLGDGPESGTIKDLIKRKELEDLVDLPGYVNGMDDWYRTFDIFVSSSIREGLAVVLLEAMAYALPVVATDVGASAEVVIDEVSGLIVPPGDPTLLANAIHRLLADESLRATLGSNARQRIEDTYSVDKVARDHGRIYQDLLDGTGIGSP